ncbi:hypothetical protein FACS1894219_08630 [Clostridia bacterium]|nr:hypothetical protein FACS1894219_08630 [Clostridia bacterium]
MPINSTHAREPPDSTGFPHHHGSERAINLKPMEEKQNEKLSETLLPALLVYIKIKV